MTNEEQAIRELDSDLFELHAILKRINFARLIDIGYRIRAGRIASLVDPDIPPVVLKQAIDATKACEELILEIHEARIAKILIKNHEKIRVVLSTNILPELDERLVPRDEIVELIDFAKHSSITSEQISLTNIDIDRMASILVLDYSDPGNFQDRPKFKPHEGARRLKMLAVVGRIINGGLLTCGNIGLCALSGVLSTIPALTAPSVSLLLGVVGSTYTGINGSLSALEVLAKMLAEKNV